MKLPRPCGHAFLWIGFLTGALTAVRSTEVADSPWSTISWPAYLAALAIAVAGVVVLRTTQKAARASSEKHAGDVAELEAILRRVLKQVQRWRTDEGRLPVHAVHQQIDEQLSDDLARFAELRESMIDAFGLQHYAAVMTEFALAERTVNRAWSASADGYVDEVEACLECGATHLENGLTRLKTAQLESG